MTEQEWLNNNQLSLDIWSKKYRYKEESFEEWLDRVSGHNSEIKRLIREKKFLFGGRTLANRGVPNSGSFSNCFIGETKIITDKGIFPIKEIKVGDLVLSDDGEYHRVNDVMSREYHGDLYEIISPNLCDKIICTPNHKFLTKDGWKRIDRCFAQKRSSKSIKSDQFKTAYAINPPLAHNGEGEIIDFYNTKLIEKDKDYSLYIEDDKVVIKQLVHQLNGTEYIRKSLCTPINRYVKIDSEFAYFIGRWLGDGSITKRKDKELHSIFQIVFNATTEREAFERCRNIGEKAFGIKASTTETKQNVLALRFENPLISEWFFQTFGEKCNGKFIPSKFRGNKNILFGLCDADGSLNTHGAFKIVLKNKELVYWIQDCMLLNNILSSPIENISYRQLDSYQLEVTVGMANGRLNGFLTKTYHDKRQNNVNTNLAEYSNITELNVLEDVSTIVYNISVEDSHTYTANGFVVHNCYSIGYVPDSLDGIMDVAHKIAMTFKAQGGQGLSLSKIRPKGSMIAGQFKSDGIVPFMHIFNTITESISQGGSRKGALMMSIDAWHPEAETFIKIKENPNEINKANLSVEIDNRFMKAFNMYTPDDIPIASHYGKAYFKKDAESIFDTICESAWKSAEPGILFVDKLRNYNLMEFVDDYQIETCNPLSL